MAYYATIAQDNTITGLYNDVIAAPPQGAIPISDNDYLTITQDVARWLLVDAVLTQNPAWVDPNSFEQQQLFYKMQVNGTADQLFNDLLRIQDGSNYLILIEKKLEAEAYNRVVENLETPVDTDYPVLNAIAISLSMTLADVVASADIQIATWTADAAAIEAERARLYHDLDEALTVQDLLDTMATANWP